MSSTKFNPTRALKVIPSDNCNVPYPTVLAQGVTVGEATDLLITSGGPFITNSIYNVNTGDVVYNITSSKAATIIEVMDNDKLLLNADIMLVGEEFIIYQEGPTTGQGNQGCLLYIGAGSSTSLHITTIGQDDMEIPKATLGLFVIQTKKVWATGTEFGAGEIYAIW